MSTRAQEFVAEFNLGRVRSKSAKRTPGQGAHSAPDGQELSAAARQEFERRYRLGCMGRTDPSTARTPGASATSPELPHYAALAGPEEDRGFLRLMREDLDRFQLRCREAEAEGGAVAFLWRCGEPELQAAVAAEAVPVLCRGAFIVLIEQFRHYPGTGDREALLAWLESAQNLSMLFDRTGIWPLLAGEIEDNSEMAFGIKAMAGYLDMSVDSDFVDFLGLEPTADAYLHFLHWALNLETVELHQLGGPDELPELGCRSQHERILGEVLSVPVPELFGTNANLFQAVMPQLASPGSGGMDDDMVAMSLFLAACMSSADHRLKRGYPWFSWDRPYAYEERDQLAAVQGLLGSAMAWLGGTLPHFAFSPDLEAPIEAAAALPAEAGA